MTSGKKATQRCPCGYLNDPSRQCVCTPVQVQRYLARISGPLLDRIDLHIEVTPVPFEELSRKRDSEPSSSVRERIVAARGIQTARFEDLEGIYANGQMPPRLVRRTCSLDRSGLRPDSESLEDDCRSGGIGGYPFCTCLRGDTIPFTGQKLGGLVPSRSS